MIKVDLSDKSRMILIDTCLYKIDKRKRGGVIYWFDIYLIKNKRKKKEGGNKDKSYLDKREKERKKGERVIIKVIDVYFHYGSEWEIRIEHLSGFAKFRTRVRVDYITNRSPSPLSLFFHFVFFNYSTWIHPLIFKTHWNFSQKENQLALFVDLLFIWQVTYSLYLFLSLIHFFFN